MINFFHGVIVPGRLFSFPITASAPFEHCTFFPATTPHQFFHDGKKDGRDFKQ
jgi:hypothetical protein